MRRLLIILALLPPALWSAAPAPSPGKPVAPIDLEVSLEGDPAAGCRIAAAASGRGREVELEIDLPAGTAVLAGERKGAGKRVELRVDARTFDRKRREVFVRATVREGDAVLTRVAPLVLHDAPAAPPGIPRLGARGEPLLEFGP